MSQRTRLFRHTRPYDTDGTRELFVQAVRENVLHHDAHCEGYHRMLAACGFSPRSLQTESDLERLPPLPTLLFKHHRLISRPEHRIVLEATSSGTKGSFSRIAFDLGSLACGTPMVLHTAAHRRLLSPRPVNYIILGYKPHRGNRMAVARTAFGSTFLAPALHRSYALQYRDGGYVPDLEHVLAHLTAYSRLPFPVRFMGFPSYTYFLLRRMEERGVRLMLPKHSKIMLGGGWKEFYTQQVDKPVLYEMIRRLLGVEESHVIEFFGAVEHPILYCDCPYHHFHIPIYSRVLIRDVHTLEALPPGQPGLVNLITPLMTAVPVTSILTDDLGILHEEPCPCGIRSPYLELLGRVGLQDIRTCAAGAAQLLGGEGGLT
ncbi:MAG: acyl-protein synthetase [Oscillospiraceae bacterium]|nr:acyl-protein synthetase [Oscillospiraceae bacterium]